MNKVKGTYQSKGQIGKRLKGRFTRKEFLQFQMQLSNLGIKPWHTSISGPITGYQAKVLSRAISSLYPKKDVVAVRMIKLSKDYNNQTDGLGNFARMVYKLATK